MNHYFVLINPAAGSVTDKLVKKIRSILHEREVSFEIYFTTEKSNGKAIVAHQFNERFTHLIVVGGDGTLNEAINGMHDFSKPVGLLPYGTGNDYIKNFKTSKTLNNRISEILRNDMTEVSVGICNDRYFINGIGAGFDGQISFNMKNEKIWLKGHAAYYFHVLKILGFYKEQKVTFSIDDEEFQQESLLILAGLGTTYGGGFKILPHGSVTKGNLAVCTIKKVHPLKRFFLVNKLKFGKHESINAVKFHSCKTVTISQGVIQGQMDGELFGVPPFKISIAPDRVKFLGLLK